jgi:hypothetical protein
MKVFIITLFVCFGIKGFSQSLDSTVVKTDPKTLMWKNIRAESAKNDTFKLKVANTFNPNNDPKTEMWKKQRSESTNIQSTPKVYTNEEIKIIEQKKKNHLNEKPE